MSRPFKVTPDLGTGIKEIVDRIQSLDGYRIPFDRIMLEVECYLLDTALKISNENKNRASEYLGIGRTTILEKCRKLFPHRVAKRREW